MRKITHFYFFFALAFTVLLYNHGRLNAQTILSTYPTTISNNGTQGVTFELTTTQTIILDSIYAALFGAGSSTFDVYYRVGGVQSTPGVAPTINAANGWTMLGSTSASSTIAGVPVPLPLSFGLLLVPGTYGFFLNTTNIGYKTWVSGSVDVFTDGTVTIETGNNKGYGGPAPNPGFHPRQFVGAIRYTIIATGPDDAGVSEINTPVASCEGTYDVAVTIRNYGTNRINNLTINWELGGVLQPSVNYAQMLDTLFGALPNSATVQLGTAALTSGVPTDLKVWTSFPNNNPDTVYYNDTSYRAYNNVLPTVNTFPYIEDFEGGQANWTMGGSVTTWAFGTPAKPVINGAASGVNCFVTGGLTGQYVNNENSQVASPCFDLTAFEGVAWVAMDVWWNSEFSWDGAVLQYSIDGVKWNNVGKMGDPHNWYTDNSINGNPGGQMEGWTGRNITSNGSGGWVRAKHAVDSSVLGQPGVRFRVAFGSDGSVPDEGFAFDNFILVDYKRANLGPDVISLCGEPNLILDPDVYYPGKIEWSTGDTLSQTIQVNTADTYWVIFTDSLLDLTSGDTVEIIDTDPPQINFTKSIDTVAVTSATTIDPNLPYIHAFLWTPGNFQYPYLLVKGSEYGVGAHTFNLLVTDSVECKDQGTAVVVFVDITGIDGVERGQITFYPNPAKDRITVQLQDVPADRLSVFNMLGQQLYGAPINKRQQMDIDISAYDPGMYVLVITVGDERITHRFIKE